MPTKLLWKPILTRCGAAQKDLRTLAWNGPRQLRVALSFVTMICSTNQHAFGSLSFLCHYPYTHAKSNSFQPLVRVGVTRNTTVQLVIQVSVHYIIHITLLPMPIRFSCFPLYSRRPQYSHNCLSVMTSQGVPEDRVVRLLPTDGTSDRGFIPRWASRMPMTIAECL